MRSPLAHPANQVPETERRFKVEIGGAKVKGRFDRVDRLANGEVAIVDFKTGKAKTQEDADDSLQLSVYALAAKEIGLYRVVAGLHQSGEWNGDRIAAHAEAISEAESSEVDCRQDRRRRIRSQAQRRLCVVFVSEHLPGAGRAASASRDNRQPNELEGIGWSMPSRLLKTPREGESVDWPSGQRPRVYSLLSRLQPAERALSMLAPSKSGLLHPLQDETLKIGFPRKSEGDACAPPRLT